MTYIMTGNIKTDYVKMKETLGAKSTNKKRKAKGWR
jgi:hypothetical protein